MELTISSAFELYRLEKIVYMNQSSKTEEMNRLAMRSLVNYLGDMPIEELTFDLVRKWKDELTRTKSQNTVRGYILKLRVVLAHLRLQGYNCLNPELVGVPKRKTVVAEFISPAEVEKLLECIFKPALGYTTINRYRNRAIVALLYASGIRVSELVALNKMSIREDGTFTTIGKGDTARLCFTDDRARQYIAEYLALRTDNDPALFMSDKTHHRMSKGVVQMIFRTVCARFGDGRIITPHTMRHSYATNLLQNNTNLYYVSKFLGHKSVQTTEMYLHYIDLDLKQIYEEKHTI